MRIHRVALSRTGRNIAVACLLAVGVCGSATADNMNMSVGATVVSQSNCQFRNVASLLLDFGAINPGSAANAVASTTFTIRCNGSANPATYSVTGGNGLYSSGPGSRRMRHQTTLTEFLPYALSFSPASATVPKGVDQTITVTGTIQPFQFANVAQGSYADTVLVTVSP
jgi:spore coat protein U-like protein